MAYREALRRPQRLSDSRRLYIEAQQAAARLDWPAAKAALERLLRDNPPLVEASVACNALGNALVRLGRDEEALESYSRGIALAPFGPTQASIINRFSLLMKLGRYEEAQGDAERLTGITHRGAMIDLAVYRRDWGRADTLARAYAEDETADQWSRSNAALSAASASAVRGRVSAAVHWLRRGRTIAQGVGPEPAASMWADEVMLSLMSGRALPSPPALARSSSLGNRFLMWPGWCAASGDSQLAERVVREVRAWLTHHPHDLDPDSLSWSDRGYLGLMAYGRKLWPDAATQLGIVATVDRDPGGGAGRFELAAAWLCADAQEHLGRTDSAAFYLERIVAPRVRYHYMEADVLGLYYSFALRRLVGIYVKLGKVPEARARWDTFSATCTHSDPDLVPAIDETRAALVAAEAMARTSRR